MKLAIAFIALSLAAGQYAPPRQGTDPLDAEREARVMRIGKGLRCPMCQGQSIADSQASAARAQLDKVRELVAAGKTDAEIEAYFVERFGEWTLLKPKPKGTNLLLWFLPLLGLLLGTWLILSQVKKPGGPTKVEPQAPPSDDDFLAQVRNDVEK